MILMKNEDKILNVMKEVTGEITVTELAIRTGISKRNISQYWKKLEIKGLITSKVVQKGRIRFIYLSYKNLPVLKKVKTRRNCLEKVKTRKKNQGDSSSVIQLEKMKVLDEKQVERIKDLLGIVSWTTITLETWINGQLRRYKFVPAVESFKRVFLQINDNDIKLISDYFRTQGYSQRESVTDNIGLNKPIVER